jgi:glutamyl/glutaminyl-tRNA synthetase
MMFSAGEKQRTGPEIANLLKRRLAAPPVTRFAPAPTGALHLGHVVNAVYVWGLARALDGRVLLRIEDHDRQRSRREAEQSMLDDLDWLGLTPDMYPTSAYRHGTSDGRQSERDEIYRHALAPLIAAGLVYGCRCTRTQLSENAADSGAGQTSAERRYPGTCRHERIALEDGVGWRLVIEPGEEAFDDAILGPQVQDPGAQCGDLLLRDRLGNWTYQCVATIDDMVQGVTLVVRGQDLLASTGRQIRLARLLGRKVPAVFAHHPLVMKSETQKLSKSDGDSGIGDLRSQGWSASDVLGHAAAIAGLMPARAPLDARDLGRLFTSPSDATST